MTALQSSAALGSKRAASDIGDFYHEGDFGFQKSNERAKHWYKKVATNPIMDLPVQFIEEAAERVREIEAGEA